MEKKDMPSLLLALAGTFSSCSYIIYMRAFI